MALNIQVPPKHREVETRRDCQTAHLSIKSNQHTSQTNCFLGNNVKPEYIEELANIADPEMLWRIPPFEQLELPDDKRKQIDAGVALRRHASHIRRLRKLLKEGKSLLITPLSDNSNAIKIVDTPPEHQVLRRKD